MGTCCTKQSNQLKHIENSLPPIPEADLLMFKVRLSKFRLRGLSEKKSFSLKVTFGLKEFVLPLAQTPFKWPDTFQFEYESSLERMSNESLTVSMINANREAASVSFDLLKVALGPVHQNFTMIKGGSTQICRISFDAEMLQMNELTVSVKQLIFKLNDPLANLYLAHFKLIADEKNERDIGEPSATPKWSFEDERENSLKLPVTIDSVRQASLQLKLYRLNKKTQDLLAECWTSFTKLFKEDQRNTIFKQESLVYSTSTNILSNLAPNSKHKKAFNESLWLFGRQVGKVSGLLVISGLPRVYQMLSGVNTERGPQLQANFVLETQPGSLFKSKKTLPVEIIQLTEHLTYLNDLVTTRSNKSVNRTSKNVSQRKTLHEIRRLLSVTHRNTMTCFDYKRDNDVQIAQDTFLNLGQYLLEYAPFVMYDIQPYFFENLTLLLQRGELDLGYLKRLIVDKPDMAERYVVFLRGTLLMAFKQLHFKGADSRLQAYVETVFVIAYFRVPKFRSVLLECFKSKGITPVEEWRGNFFDLHEDNESSVLLPVLDWENNFYAAFPTKVIDSDFEVALNGKKWQEKFTKRGVAYFRFVERFAHHIGRQFVRDNVPWHAIPGYRIILHTFLLELKERPTVAYPEALIEASCSLLSYRHLITVFVKIVFFKTNIYDYQSVIETLGLVDTWLDKMFVLGHQLPHSFDYNFFTQGLLMILRDEHSVSLAKGLLLVYRQMHMLSQAVREEVIHKYLIKDNFLRFFCHWNCEVRKVFQYLLIFRIVIGDTFTIHDISEEKQLRKDTVKLLKNIVEMESSDLPSEYSVYLDSAKAELIKTRQLCENWLPCLKRRKETGVYGGFESFPYPQLTINCLLLDKREEMLELDW